MIPEEARNNRGRFGRAALAMAVTASALSLLAIVVGVFLLTTEHLSNKSLNYFMGMLILLCGFFQLLAIPVGVIGLFEYSSSKRPAWIAIILSSVVFALTFLLIITGMHRVGGGN